MNLPKTYEDFLKLSNDELIKISRLPLTLEEAQLFISFINRAQTMTILKIKLLQNHKRN